LNFINRHLITEVLYGEVGFDNPSNSISQLMGEDYGKNPILNDLVPPVAWSVCLGMLDNISDWFKTLVRLSWDICQIYVTDSYVTDPYFTKT